MGAFWRWLQEIGLLRLVLGVGRKPLFEYDDHYVMLNDFGRNHFYREALEAFLASCPGCAVLDLGAGSGLLAILAARAGSEQVWAIEANPHLAELATRTLERNRELYPKTNMSVIAQLSAQVDADVLGRKADLLVTETFGTMMLGEGVLTFVSDARDRLLKEGGQIIPAGGCQYVTLVQMSEPLWSPRPWRGFNLSRLEDLQDTVYWKAMVGASSSQYIKLSERTCVLELDLYEATPEQVPKNRTFWIEMQQSGTIDAALFDWDIWADRSKKQVLSTAQGSRNFAGDVAWGWLLQPQEEAAEGWRFGDHPRRLKVKAGDWVQVAVEFIATGISMHLRARSVDPFRGPEEDSMLPPISSPSRLHGIPRQSIKEANEFLLPVAGDQERHDFYAEALQSAVRELEGRPHTLLDCSGNAGLPGFYAAKHGLLRSLVMPGSEHVASILRQIAEENGVEGAEVFAGDPREMFDVLLPEGRRADIVVVDPPGTPLHGRSPFAILPALRKELLQDKGLVVPPLACFEVGLLESLELSQMFSIPNGTWEEVDLQVWNEEARRQGLLGRMVPHTKWLGGHSTLRRRWLSQPQCLYHVDLNEYGRAPISGEETLRRSLPIEAAGFVHAIVGRWVVFAEKGPAARRLGAESTYEGRDLTWPQYVQAVARADTNLGLLEPLPVEAGAVLQLKVTVRLGAAKVTGSAGPEFALQLVGTDQDDASARRGDSGRRTGEASTEL
ncbi:PRMT7 [Symbiodinium sp. CCMP2592]|nr:PRMT7 [Symbiodinium sp. CCMP2592]